MTGGLEEVLLRGIVVGTRFSFSLTLSGVQMLIFAFSHSNGYRVDVAFKFFFLQNYRFFINGGGLGVFPLCYFIWWL